MYITSNFTGCLITSVIFLLALYLLKELWWVIVGIALILIALYWGKKIYYLLKEMKESRDTTYNPQMGEVFKMCPYCGAKVTVKQITCPVCKHALN